VLVEDDVMLPYAVVVFVVNFPGFHCELSGSEVNDSSMQLLAFCFLMAGHIPRPWFQVWARDQI
jgi:hypothetical protein